MSVNEGATNAKDPRSNLPISIGTELLIEIVNLGLRIKGTLVGLEYGSYVILRISPRDLVGNFRSEDVLGSAIIVRYLFKGSVYGFKTSIMNTVSNPARIIFTKYPENIEGMNIRTNQRYSCILPVRTTLGNEAFDGVMVDISMDGGRCVIRRPPGPEMDSLCLAIDANKTAEIKLDLPGMDKPVEVKISVRNISKDNDRVSFGASFEPMAQQDRSNLQKFISLITEAGEPA